MYEKLKIRVIGDALQPKDNTSSFQKSLKSGGKKALGKKPGTRTVASR